MFSYNLERFSGMASSEQLLAADLKVAG